MFLLPGLSPPVPLCGGPAAVAAEDPRGGKYLCSSCPQDRRQRCGNTEHPTVEEGDFLLTAFKERAFSAVYSSMFLSSMKLRRRSVLAVTGSACF